MTIVYTADTGLCTQITGTKIRISITVRIFTTFMALVAHTILRPWFSAVGIFVTLYTEI